jgi:hypothetical protein
MIVGLSWSCLSSFNSVSPSSTAFVVLLIGVRVLHAFTLILVSALDIRCTKTLLFRLVLTLPLPCLAYGLGVWGGNLPIPDFNSWFFSDGSAGVVGVVPVGTVRGWRDVVWLIGGVGEVGLNLLCGFLERRRAKMGGEWRIFRWILLGNGDTSSINPIPLQSRKKLDKWFGWGIPVSSNWWADTKERLIRSSRFLIIMAGIYSLYPVRQSAGEIDAQVTIQFAVGPFSLSCVGVGLIFCLQRVYATMQMGSGCGVSESWMYNMMLRKSIEYRAIGGRGVKTSYYVETGELVQIVGNTEQQPMQTRASDESAESPTLNLRRKKKAGTFSSPQSHANQDQNKTQNQQSLEHDSVAVTILDTNDTYNASNTPPKSFPLWELDPPISTFWLAIHIPIWMSTLVAFTGLKLILQQFYNDYLGLSGFTPTGPPPVNINISDLVPPGSLQQSGSLSYAALLLNYTTSVTGATSSFFPVRTLNDVWDFKEGSVLLGVGVACFIIFSALGGFLEGVSNSILLSYLAPSRNDDNASFKSAESLSKQSRQFTIPKQNQRNENIPSEQISKSEPRTATERKSSISLTKPKEAEKLTTPYTNPKEAASTAAALAKDEQFWRDVWKAEDGFSDAEKSLKKRKTRGRETLRGGHFHMSWGSNSGKMVEGGNTHHTASSAFGSWWKSMSVSPNRKKSGEKTKKFKFSRNANFGDDGGALSDATNDSHKHSGAISSNDEDDQGGEADGEDNDDEDEEILEREYQRAIRNIPLGIGEESFHHPFATVSTAPLNPEISDEATNTVRAPRKSAPSAKKSIPDKALQEPRDADVATNIPMASHQSLHSQIFNRRLLVPLFLRALISIYYFALVPFTHFFTTYVTSNSNSSFRWNHLNGNMDRWSESVPGRTTTREANYIEIRAFFMLILVTAAALFHALVEEVVKWLNSDTMGGSGKSNVKSDYQTREGGLWSWWWWVCDDDKSEGDPPGFGDPLSEESGTGGWMLTWRRGWMVGGGWGSSRRLPKVDHIV